jgi:short-subunit dehydrogenase
VITGASSGIGRATALKFARNGDFVVAAARRKNLLKSLANECERLGTEALPVEADVSNERSVEKLAKAAVQKFGRIDVWINNAGVGAAGTFHDVKPEEHKRVIETNLLGTINGSWQALRQFKKQREGILINISSVLGKVTQPYMASYSASKHGVRALSGCIRQELWLKNLKDIYVCTVFPQSVDTPFFRNEANRTGYKLKPAPPIETPEHAAAVIVDLAENPQDEVHVGKMGKFMAMQQKLARGATEKQMAAMTERKHFDRGRHERPSSGTLWRSDRSDEGAIHGDWKNGSSWKKPVSVAGVAAPAVLGLFLVLKNRRSSQLREVA